MPLAGSAASQSLHAIGLDRPAAELDPIAGSCEKRGMNRIRSDPKVMFGKPVIAGTRITVEHILRCLAGGEAPADIVGDYPPLTLDDIRAAQAFAADHLAREAVFAAE
jgi:uncharacterized protein (DUF433 family)